MAKIDGVHDVYSFVARLKAEAEKQRAVKLIADINHAMGLGSSGLEVLGAIRSLIIIHRDEIKKLLDSSGADEVTRIIAFVDKAYGRK